MKREVKIGNRMVGDGHPVYIIAEIGINHNGDLEIAKQMIDAAVHAGVDAVKFQKRTPELSTPPEQQKQMRETPWGYITYLEYRHKVEFDEAQYREIDRYCKEKQITWFASVWDEQAVDFMEKFDTPVYKIPSASLTDHDLLRHTRKTGRPLVLSTGMSTMEEIRAAGLYRSIGQSFAVLLPVTTVGVMGDERSYEHVVALRAVETTDFMTADWVHLPYDLLATISNRIINEVRGVNRVVYDISSKPPSTIEWE